MNTHKLRLEAVPFETVKSGAKTIESRLYDKKRQLIDLGDTLIFTNRENEGETINATVIGLHRYTTFRDLFRHNDLAKFGGSSVEWLENQIDEFYSADSQEEKGVVGIEFVINN